MNRESEKIYEELQKLKEKVSTYEQVFKDIHLYSTILSDHNALRNVIALVNNWVEHENDQISFDMLKLREYDKSAWNSNIETPYNKLRL